MMLQVSNKSYGIIIIYTSDGFKPTYIMYKLQKVYQQWTWFTLARVNYMYLFMNRQEFALDIHVDMGGISLLTCCGSILFLV